MEGITLTQKEEARLQMLNGVLQGAVGVPEAAEVLGISGRHVRRILAAYRRKGAAALAHGNRGRQPANRVSDETRQEVIGLARARYVGVNHTHLTELLEENEGLVMGRSTVRRILKGAGIASPRGRRRPRHRCRRQRMPQEGMMLQIDGSQHDWLEARGPQLTLLFAIDDATGTAPYALFRQEEDTEGYFLLVRGIIERKGIPLALYSDRHGVFVHAGKRGEDLLPREREPTQFGRAMRELGIHQIFALSPEAKGRAERAAGTFQDRLVSELRLAGAGTEAEANRVLANFLRRYNGRFGVAPAQPSSAYRPVDPDLDLEAVLCWKYRRKVERDNTVRYDGRVLQLLPDAQRPTYKGARVEVQVRLDSRLLLFSQGRLVLSQEAPPRAAILRARNGAWPGLSTLPRCLVGGVSPGSDGDQGRGGMQVADTADEGAAEGSLSLSRGDHRMSRSNNGRDGGTPRLRNTPFPRRPTPRKVARWHAIQDALDQGLSLRAIARQLGMGRNTVRRYVRLGGPPVYVRRQASSTTSGGSNGQNR